MSVRTTSYLATLFESQGFSLPEEYAPDSSNLLVEGMTFSDAEKTNPEDLAVVAYFSGPGENMALRNCLFTSINDGTDPMLAAVATIRFAESPTTSISIIDCVVSENCSRLLVVYDALLAFEWCIELTVRLCCGSYDDDV